MTPANRIWRVVRDPEFRTDFRQLDGSGQWIVEKYLDAMVQQRDPTTKYHNVTCDNCNPDTRLFGIQDDGVGNKRLGLLIRFDRQRNVLYPLGVRPVRPTDGF